MYRQPRIKSVVLAILDLPFKIRYAGLPYLPARPPIVKDLS
jgi:hypothetical protein